MAEQLNFVVVIRKDSLTAELFGENVDGQDKGHPALFASKVDLSGVHALVRRVPRPGTPAYERGSRVQNFWMPCSDIALVFEYDEKSNPPGFG